MEVGDLQKLRQFPGSDDPATDIGVFLHELAEQWEYQAHNADYAPAHRAGMIAEALLNGWLRLPEGEAPPNCAQFNCVRAKEKDQDGKPKNLEKRSVITHLDPKGGITGVDYVRPGK